MRVVDNFPYPVTAIENVWIPMPDGARLAARLWLPEGASDDPVPAIVEYIPYRKRDSTRARDSRIYPWFAGYGYAGLRVDLRGSGDSDGVLHDEYLQQELEDGVAVLAWLEEQPWCNGRVGLMGISWGGFNALQIAALRPPQLKAVISASSTVDRFADDVHHMGGCLLGDNLSWASTMFAYNASPPDPVIVGGRWREMWFERLRGSGLWLDTWLRHQRRDAYWKHGSVAEDYGAIQCPVMAVSGWADGYSNTVFHLLANLQVPCLGLIGPWGHKYPHIGLPGPAIGFLQEARRWWDKWLKDEESGIMAEPALRAWMQDSVPPFTRYQSRPGRWVAESVWPSPRVKEHVYTLGPSRQLIPGDKPVNERAHSLQSPLSLGLFAGKWCSYAAAPDLPHDQRQEDGGALTYDSPALERGLEILGAPRLEVDLVCDRPIAMLAVRLSDIAPDNKATRITYGLLNLSHREGSERPRPLEPGQRHRVTVNLNYIAQSFPPGHRLRLAISTSYWPLAWPAPEAAMVQILTGTSRFHVPVRPPREEDRQIGFEPAEAAPPLDYQLLQPERHTWRVIRDLDSDESTLEVINDEGIHYIPEVDLAIGRKAEEWYSSQADDFDSVRGETLWERSFQRRGWEVHTRTRTVLTSGPAHFRLRAELDAWEGGTRVYSENWDTRIPRDLGSF